MANLSITTECNRHCRYCFARPALRDQGPEVQHISLDTFQRALDFLERSGIDQARLLGGEPTLHPDFPRLVEQVMDRGLRLLVFSNGLMAENVLRCLENTPMEHIAILLNVLVPGTSHPEEHTRQIEVLRRLGCRVIPGLNIDTAAVQFDFMLELIEKYGLARTVRLGLAHLSATGDNHFLHPQYYAAVGRRVIEFATKAHAADVHLEFDCGFVPCMFLSEGLEILGKSAKEIGTRCNPILDILPDGQVVSCYPLANLHHEPLPDEQDASWLRNQFEEKLKPYRSLGIFKACSSCLLQKSGMCVGGCLAAAMQRLRSASFTFFHPLLTSPIKGGLVDKSSSPLDLPIQQKQANGDVNTQWVIPYIDQPLSFWERITEDYTQNINEVYVPLPGDVLGSGRPPQPTEHLNEFLHRSPFPFSVLINPIILPRPVEELAPNIIETLRRLMSESDLAGATVSDLLLANRIREALPEFPLTASVLMNITQPNQVLMLKETFDNLVPASRIMRDLVALKILREAFPGRIRLIVNEACLPNCPFRVQHFYEMGINMRQHPRSLCNDLLRKYPWMRLTGAWVLPQHLHLYDGVYDELKLSGRVTLRDPDVYLKVLEAYLHRQPLPPNEIGGGPASALEPLNISEEFFTRTLHCRHQCHTCTLCRDYYQTVCSNRFSDFLIAEAVTTNPSKHP